MNVKYYTQSVNDKSRAQTMYQMLSANTTEPQNRHTRGKKRTDKPTQKAE